MSYIRVMHHLSELARERGAVMDRLGELARERGAGHGPSPLSEIAPARAPPLADRD